MFPLHNEQCAHNYLSQLPITQSKKEVKSYQLYNLYFLLDEMQNTTLLWKHKHTVIRNKSSSFSASISCALPQSVVNVLEAEYGF